MKFYTLKQLKHFSKIHLIRIVLALQSRLHGRPHVVHSRARKRSTRKLRPGIHTVDVGGRQRKVKVLANGQWRFK